MAPVKIKYIVSFSSQDDNHKASNLITSDGFKRWLSSSKDRSGKIELVLQLDEPCQLAYIDIGTVWCASVEVRVGCSDWPQSAEFESLTPTTTLMSPVDCQLSRATNSTKMFSKSDFSTAVASQKWDRLQVICRQPYRKDVQFGVSFIRIKSSNQSQPDTVSQNKTTGLRTPTGKTSTPNVTAIQKHFFGGSKSVDQLKKEHVGQLKHKLLKMSGSSEGGCEQEQSLSRTAQIVMKASESAGLFSPSARRYSPTPHRRLFSEHLAKKQSVPIEKEMEHFFPTLEVSKCDIDQVTVADLRHKFERRIKRKLTIEEKRTFSEVCQNYICGLFDSNPGEKESTSIFDLQPPENIATVKRSSMSENIAAVKRSSASENVAAVKRSSTSENIAMVKRSPASKVSSVSAASPTLSLRAGKDDDTFTVVKPPIDKSKSPVVISKSAAKPSPSPVGGNKVGSKMMNISALKSPLSVLVKPVIGAKSNVSDTNKDDNSDDSDLSGGVDDVESLSSVSYHEDDDGIDCDVSDTRISEKADPSAPCRTLAEVNRSYAKLYGEGVVLDSSKPKSYGDEKERVCTKSPDANEDNLILSEPKKKKRRRKQNDNKKKGRGKRRKLNQDSLDLLKDFCSLISSEEEDTDSQTMTQSLTPGKKINDRKSTCDAESKIVENNAEDSQMTQQPKPFTEVTTTRINRRADSPGGRVYRMYSSTTKSKKSNRHSENELAGELSGFVMRVGEDKSEDIANDVSDALSLKRNKNRKFGGNVSFPKTCDQNNRLNRSSELQDSPWRAESDCAGGDRGRGRRGSEASGRGRGNRKRGRKSAGRGRGKSQVEESEDRTSNDDVQTFCDKCFEFFPDDFFPHHYLLCQAGRTHATDAIGQGHPRDEYLIDEDVDYAECPICLRKFPQDVLTVHASECGL
ncbi:uncharacterized protein LOC101863706 [Aplysia californica]|uniref:Uncharacterized protein LOC101863706 n=1 Tax=Aplysia californica TaxID=6500 RepID=A0ABM0K8N4_APLCA|nr:uncharacterized protein LOC101863706 [Aplysia californica]